MEPLITLTERGKARITAREAEAEALSQYVRGAFEEDPEQARHQWASYFASQQKDLSIAIREAKSSAEAEALVVATFIFLAHAYEYKGILSLESGLGEVLSTLGLAVITKYGQPVRATLQRLE